MLEFLQNLMRMNVDPVLHTGWYVLSNLKKKSKSKANDELQIILEHMISSGLENEYIKARSRGGLATPCINDLVKLL